MFTNESKFKTSLLAIIFRCEPSSSFEWNFVNAILFEWNVKDTGNYKNVNIFAFFVFNNNEKKIVKHSNGRLINGPLLIA